MRVQFLESPTSPHESDPAEEFENLQNYKEHLNDIAIRLEGGLPLTDSFPYDEDLLHYTFELYPRVAPHYRGSEPEFYPNSE